MQRLSVVFFLCISTIWAKPWNVPSKDLDNVGIINGMNATRGQLPWDVAMYVTLSSSTIFCGGALISESWVLTAGHCVQGASHFRISLGSTLLTGDDSDRVVVETNDFIQHENYNSQTLANDIALILLPVSLTFTDTIQPITLSADIIDSYTNVIISGWGLTSNSGTTPSNDLQYTTVMTIANAACEDAFSKPMPSSVICAQSTGVPVHNTCQGDSGGPLVLAPDSNWPVHVGIVSFGHYLGCESGEPSGFTRTSYFRDWIKGKTGI